MQEGRTIKGKQGNEKMKTEVKEDERERQTANKKREKLERK